MGTGFRTGCLNQTTSWVDDIKVMGVKQVIVPVYGGKDYRRIFKRNFLLIFNVSSCVFMVKSCQKIYRGIRWRQGSRLKR
jgi:hypothetical protein